MVRALVTQEYTYAYAAVCPTDGGMDSLILPHVNGRCMQLLIDEVAARYRNERIIMIVDGAGWHKSSEIRLPDNLRLLSLPPYAPELNPVWDDLREKHFHNHVFDSLDALENHLVTALLAYENNAKCVASITGWQWIINALQN
jgi:hypothetical protein